MLGARKQLPYLFQSECSHTYWLVSINCINMSFFDFMWPQSGFIPLWPWCRDVCAQSLVKTRAMNYVCKVFLFQTTCWWSDSEDKKWCIHLVPHLLFQLLHSQRLAFGGGGASLTWMICAPAHRLEWSCSSNISPSPTSAGVFGTLSHTPLAVWVIFYCVNLFSAVNSFSVSCAWIEFGPASHHDPTEAALFRTTP